MNRESITRLIQCIVVPFVGMFAVGRLTGWLFDWLGTVSWVRDFGSFLTAALAAAFLYRCLDPDGWSRAFSEAVGEPCSMPLAFCHVGYSLLWLIGSLSVIELLFPAQVESDRVLAGSVLSAVLVHPILEEWLFRRIFLSRLLDLADGEGPAAEVVPEDGEIPKRKYTKAGMLFAVLTQAVLFALLHRGGGAMLYGFAGGIILGVLMLRTGRLLVPVAAHMAINLRSVVWPHLASQTAFRLDLVLIVLGLLCGGCFWAVRIRQMRAEGIGTTGEDRHEP